MSKEQNNSKILLREDVPAELTWDTTLIYPSDEAAEAAISAVKDKSEKIEGFKGHLADASDTLADAIETILGVYRQIEKAYVYSHLKYDQDTTNTKYQGLQQQALSVFTQVSGSSAFFEPEVLAIPLDKLEGFVAGNDRLKPYKHYLDQLTVNKDHVLSADQETILANAEAVFSGASQTYNILTNADLDLGEVKDEDGNIVPLTHGLFGSLLRSKNREVREEVYNQLYDRFESIKNTTASTLATHVKKHNFNATTRGYSSARQASLAQNFIPESVYETLVEEVNRHLPLLHRYVALRKKALKLDEIKMSDMYVPLNPDHDQKLTFDEARDIALKALAPFGEDYVEILNEGFANRWIDIKENKGKRSGAYSSGMYDTVPYILLNWQDDFSQLFTLVHEFGHSAHSYYTRHNQPYVYGDYPIFLAEIASTTNECVLTEHLLNTETDPKTRLAVLNDYLDRFKSTVFRQTQFAEFERYIHAADQAGKPLTVDFLSDYYGELNKRYYGNDVTYDDHIKYEWSRIPHFYYNFYVYQYSTGLAAATTLADKILTEGDSAVEAYKNYLKAGSSDYPIDVMKSAGVDMTSPDYLRHAFKVFEKRLDELEELLEEVGK